MSTKVIKKYLAEGVLNYIEHANPRHYFLYDGVMDEESADVHRLVEDLCDENMGLQKRVKELEAERDDYAFKLAEANNTYSEMHVAMSEAHDKLAKAMKGSFFEGFCEGRDGGWVWGDPTPAWKKSDALAELKGDSDE